MGKLIDQLSDEERVSYYRGLATEAMQKAHEAVSGDVRVAYVDIAMRWSAIADEAHRLGLREQERARIIKEYREQARHGALTAGIPVT